jgi:mannose-6-phosphate isomerase-like protein (cupin superfamily)
VSERLGPYQATETYVHLGPEGTSVPLQVTSSFWQQLASGAFAHPGPGRLVSCYDFSESWDSWESHPGGEEVVVLLSGAVDFLLEVDDEERVVPLTKQGQFLIVPRGTWHTANVRGSASMLFITAGEGTKHRPRK